MHYPFSKPAFTLLLKVAALLAVFFADSPAFAQQKASSNNDVYVRVDQAAIFPGGVTSLYSYLAKNIHYPAAARENNVQGKVFVSFVVEKDGALKNIKVKKGVGSGIDEEAVRVLAASPKWTPAKQKGSIVRSQYTLPIAFTLAANEKVAETKSDKPAYPKQAYREVDKSAEFPGGANQFYAYLAKTIHYPAVARNKNVQGKVFLTFVVEEDGTLTDIQVARGIGAGCDEEALKAMQNSPKWIPAKLNGEVVRQVYTVPINFSLAKS